jgi:hypothetical protein
LCLAPPPLLTRDHNNVLSQSTNRMLVFKLSHSSTSPYILPALPSSPPTPYPSPPPPLLPVLIPPVSPSHSPPFTSLPVFLDNRLFH